MTLNFWETDAVKMWPTLPVWKLCIAAGLMLGTSAFASSAVAADQVMQRESAGDLTAARSLLEEQAKDGGSAAAANLAEFLDRHGSADSRDAYAKWAAGEKDAAKRQIAWRQVVLLDYVQGRTADLGPDLRQYKDAGGTDLNVPAKKATSSDLYSKITLPGPLPAFARMAALSPDLAPEELLPALARNLVTNGFQAVSANESLEQTEYLRLLVRYVTQARELESMAGKEHKIVIPACDSEQTGALLKVLGYRMRGSCGSDIVLETVNATRAFLTVDSGFPLVQLEQDLRANRRFELPWEPTQVSVLYNSGYWLSAMNKDSTANFIDAFLSDPSLCRLYLGLSRLDRATADALRKQAPAAKLKLYAHVLDFYGSMFQLRNGAAVTPGSAKSWASMVGTSPNNGGAFFERLVTVDDGWLASYFDALSRMDGPAASYLTDPERVKRFYDALRGKVTTPGPARPVFRSSTELLLLTTSLRLETNGQPHIPGDLEMWRTLFIKHPHGKYDGKLTRSAATWRNNDDILEALFALCRKSVENEPLRIFLALNDIDRGREKPISPALASRLANSYRAHGSQYTLFADSPRLSEASINHYMDLIASTTNMHDTLVKADAVGTLQALVGLWQIFSRDGEIAPGIQDSSFTKLITPFDRIRINSEVFDAGRSGVDLLLASATGAGTGTRMDRLMDLLVGRMQGGGPERPSPAQNFSRIYDAQRLISVDNLFAVADRLGKGTGDTKALSAVTAQLARIEETQSLRSSLTSEEKSMLSLGYWSERHIDQEHKLNLDSLLKNPEKKDARGALAPFLRDSLVGMIYAYYAPPGAQLLVTNPLFIRSHDFIGTQGLPMEWRSTEVTGTGWPASAGGRLMGSLSALPYAIAEAEQNFLTPTREQALIWGDLVPQMIVNVTVARWRNVSPVQLRWVDLHLQRGRNLLAGAALDPALQVKVLTAYARLATPARVEHLADQLNSGDFAQAQAQIPPSELYAIADDPALRDASPDLASQALASVLSESAKDVSPEAISRAFGTPKPTLTHSYQPALLRLRTFPTLMGYSSRILAETWESNNLYYAALADEIGVPANQLDSFVPEWTRATIENIFATHLEDWPALLRSLHTVGDNIRQHGTHRASVTSSEE